MTTTTATTTEARLDAVWTAIRGIRSAAFGMGHEPNAGQVLRLAALELERDALLAELEAAWQYVAGARAERWTNLADDELWASSELTFDTAWRIWAPTFDGRDAIVGSHTVGRLPAAQRYGLNVVRFLEAQRRDARLLAAIELDLAGLGEPF